VKVFQSNQGLVLKQTVGLLVQMKAQNEGKWHSVVDKNSGRTYFYNDISKKTTWDKPAELMTDEEAASANNERRIRREFFDAMERNIFNKMAGESRSTSPRVDLMEEQMLIDERQRCMSTDSTDSQNATQFRARTISTIDSEMNSFMRKQAINSTAAAGGDGHGLGASPLSRDMSFLKLQAKDDTADMYSPRRSNSGQWGGMAAGLLDPGAEAKFAAACRQEDKQGGYLGGQSIMGTSPSDVSNDFDFLREIDYLTGRRGVDGKDKSKAAAAKDQLLNSHHSVSSPRATNNPRKTGLQRRNSTSTLFISSTMEQQDNDATIRCVAVVIRAHMRSANKSMRLPSAKYDTFLDAAYRDEDEERDYAPASPPTRAESKLGSTALPIAQSKLVFGERSIGRARSGTNTGLRTMAIPTVEEIEGFLLEIFNKSQLEGECIIMSLIYCERLVKQTKGHLCIRYDNWRSICFACLVMASKVWDDLSMWNVDFSNVCSSFDLQRVNELEMAMLNILSYSIKVSASEYAKYYFHLRSMMARLGINRTRSTMPLDLASAKKLQLRTESLETNYPLGNSRGLATPHQTRNRGTTTVGQAPNSLDRVSLNRTVSIEGSGVMSSKPKSVFLGIDDLMHSSHTNADGTDRTIKEKYPKSPVIALQEYAEAKRSTR